MLGRAERKEYVQWTYLANEPGCGKEEWEVGQ